MRPTGSRPTLSRQGSAAGCSGDGKRAGIGSRNGFAEESDGSAVFIRQRHRFRGTGVIETLSAELSPATMPAYPSCPDTR